MYQLYLVALLGQHGKLLRVEPTVSRFIEAREGFSPVFNAPA